MANLATETGRFDLVVRAIKQEARNIISLQLVDPKGKELPRWGAGTHIEVDLAEGVKRQYSLCNSPKERHYFEIAVLKERNSRGGSLALHQLQVGSKITVSALRNNFSLAGTEAVHHLLIGGGIGVTPLLAMVEELKTRGADFHLHFCARDREGVPFAERFEVLANEGRATVHLDGGDVSRGLDIPRILETPIPAQHVYVCGPGGMMDVARDSVGAWAPHTVHFERFSGEPIPMEEDIWEDVSFEVIAKRSGKKVTVPAKCSIVEALRSAGVTISVSCEAGFCGACLTRVLAGDPVHRDTVLSKAERKTYTLVCRARSRSQELVLDV